MPIFDRFPSGSSVPKDKVLVVLEPSVARDGRENSGRLARECPPVQSHGREMRSGASLRFNRNDEPSSRAALRLALSIWFRQVLKRRY